MLLRIALFGFIMPLLLVIYGKYGKCITFLAKWNEDKESRSILEINRSKYNTEHFAIVLFFLTLLELMLYNFRLNFYYRVC